MREIVHLQAGQCGNQIGGKVSLQICSVIELVDRSRKIPKWRYHVAPCLAMWVNFGHVAAVC